VQEKNSRSIDFLVLIYFIILQWSVSEPYKRLVVTRHRKKCRRIDIKIDRTLAARCSTCLRRSRITVGRGYVVSGTILPKTDKILPW